MKGSETGDKEPSPASEPPPSPVSVFIGKQGLEFFTEKSYNKKRLQDQLYRARFHFRIFPEDVNVPA